MKGLLRNLGGASVMCWRGDLQLPLDFKVFEARKALLAIMEVLRTGPSARRSLTSEPNIVTQAKP